MKALPVSLLFLCLACGPAPETPSTTAIVIPELTIDQASGTCSSRKGFLYHQDSLFSGWLEVYYANDSLKSRTPYWQGKQHGLAQGWYTNGAPWFNRTYSHGLKNDLHTGWWDNGQLKFQYHFQDGLHEGNAKEWYPSGQLAKDFNYVNGQEQGAQKLWQADGKIHANYVVVGNRRYGLTGTKHCKSKVDETL